MIPLETVQLILDTAQIHEVVGDYVTLKRRGASYVACCPFHNEKTPSFHVTPSKGIYKCFGCGKAGSALSFVMEMEHCSYPEALRLLAKRYHIEIVEETPSAEEIAHRQRRESIYLALEFAQKFFTEQLKAGEGRAVGYNYFRTRALEDETIAHFGLGWAPSGKTNLLDAAVAAGYKTEFLEAAGLIVKREDGSYIDKFRARAMFPIHSVSGRVIAYSGRTLSADNPAKYVNSAETEVYVKGRNLLGIYFAKNAISRENSCILVEGNVDMVMMHQLGIGNVVASCGTALTVEQIRLIRRFTENVVMMYDGDKAGIKAALKGINLILAEGLNVKVVLLPDGDDPDSFCRKHTLSEVKEFIASSQKDFIGFKTELLLADAAGDPLQKANVINDIADSIAQIPDPVKRATYVEATASSFGIESGLLFNRIKDTRLSKHEREIVEQPSQTWVPENPILEPAERELLGFLMLSGTSELKFQSDSEFYPGDGEPAPTVADFIAGALEEDETSFANSLYSRLYDAYFALYDAGYSQEQIMASLLNSQERDMADLAAELATNKYDLTVKSFAESLTTLESWLVTYVPKGILYYNERRLESQIKDVVHALQAGGDDMLLKALSKLKTDQRKLRQLIGREKINKS